MNNFIYNENIFQFFLKNIFNMDQ
ncbi:hypothetical protein c7_L805 [Megavirus courdo7]|uniref:Uncharacterized protein n=1 Tax=Megavirus courdo7 TaxID=1128135 RepID=H2EBU5_9VIRU|nr:hypothetical protein c7_L805 [Megavirus courdo7]